jgi:hypothetical protein
MLTVDNLVVNQSFADIIVAPEPSTLALAAVGGIAFFVSFRRKR